MASNRTPSYALSQWEPGDQVLRTDFNDDNAKLDAALKAHDDALALRGNCQFWTTSYIGNGAVGPAAARSITFPRQPKIVFVAGNGGFLTMIPGVSSSPALASGSTLAINVSWSGNTLSWYGGSSGAIMMNASGITYTVLALMLP